MSFSFGSFAGVALQPLRAAAERGERTLALLVGAERGDDGQAAALLGRRRRGSASARRPGGPAAPRRGGPARRLVLVGLAA